MARLRNFVRKNGPRGFRAVLFRMVPKQMLHIEPNEAVLELCCFEWFQNRDEYAKHLKVSFRAVLFRMVPKQWVPEFIAVPLF